MQDWQQLSTTLHQSNGPPYNVTGARISHMLGSPRHYLLRWPLDCLQCAGLCWYHVRRRGVPAPVRPHSRTGPSARPGPTAPDALRLQGSTTASPAAAGSSASDAPEWHPARSKPLMTAPMDRCAYDEAAVAFPNAKHAKIHCS